MFFASPFCAISELITHRGQMPNSQPGTLALLLTSMPTLYLVILALSAWRGRKLLLKQTSTTNTRLALFAIMTGFATVAVTVSNTYLLNAYRMKLKPSYHALLERLGNQWPTLITILAILIAPVLKNYFFVNNYLRGLRLPDMRCSVVCRVACCLP